LITDKPPRKPAFQEEFARSEAMQEITLPPVEPLRQGAQQLEEALCDEDRRKVEVACNAIANTVAASFNVKAPNIKVLGVRPLEESEHSVDELFGDYDFETARIRLWMRTAVLEKTTSFGALLSTLCHEICHHLDVVSFGLPNTYHTRGFYWRAGALYHHVRGTPMRHLVWDKQKNGVYRINWPATMRGDSSPRARAQ
jgi:hypothetical protein